MAFVREDVKGKDKDLFNSFGINEISSINVNHCAKVTDVCSLWREWFRLLYDSLN